MRYLLYLSHGYCWLSIIGAALFVIQQPALLLLAVIYVVSAMILSSLIEYARDQAMMAEIGEMVGHLTRIIAAEKERRYIESIDNIVGARGKAGSIEQMQQRAEARDREAMQKTVADEVAEK